MKKLLLIIASGLILSATSVVWADGHSNARGSRIVKAAGAHPRAVQRGAKAIASRPALQRRMDSRMAANPSANDLMRRVQRAGGYTPPN